MRLRAEQGLSWDDITKQLMCVHMHMMRGNDSVQRHLNARVQ